MNVEFHDYSVQVKQAAEDAADRFLNESGILLRARTAQITKVASGQLKRSWDFFVDLAEKVCHVGSDVEHSIWNEYGTGEYAAGGNGRKGGWSYMDAKGNWHFTKGMKPRKTLATSFNANAGAVRSLAQSIFGERLGK